MSKPSIFQSYKTLIYALTALSLFLGVIIYLNYPRTSSLAIRENREADRQAKSFSKSHQPIPLVVDSHAAVPSIQRIGMDVSGWNSEKEIPPPSAMLDEMRGILKAVRPSYLRSWQGQTENMNPNSLAAFLDLCSQADANPWITISTDFKDDALDALGNYLRLNADTSKYSDVIIEFGNENPQRIFSSNYNSNEDVSDRAFSTLSEAAGPYVHLTHATHRPYADHLLSEASSGPDLAKSLIHKMSDNLQPLIVFNLVQGIPTNSNDLNNENRRGPDASIKEPWNSAGLTLIMLNQILGGSLHKIKPQVIQEPSMPAAAGNFAVAAFRSGNAWTAAIVSDHSHPAALTVEFPDDGRDLPVSMAIFPTLSHEENDKSMHQPLQIDKRKVMLTMPSHGFVVLTQ